MSKRRTIAFSNILIHISSAHGIQYTILPFCCCSRVPDFEILCQAYMCVLTQHGHIDPLWVYPYASCAIDCNRPKIPFCYTTYGQHAIIFWTGCKARQLPVDFFLYFFYSLLKLIANLCCLFMSLLHHFTPLLQLCHLCQRLPFSPPLQRFLPVLPVLPASPNDQAWVRSTRMIICPYRAMHSPVGKCALAAKRPAILTTT